MLVPLNNSALPDLRLGKVPALLGDGGKIAHHQRHGGMVLTADSSIDL